MGVANNCDLLGYSFIVASCILLRDWRPFSFWFDGTQVRDVKREAREAIAKKRREKWELNAPLWQTKVDAYVQQVREDIEQEELDRLAEEEEAAKEAAKERRKRQQEARDAAIAEYGEGGAKNQIADGGGDGGGD